MSSTSLGDGGRSWPRLILGRPAGPPVPGAGQRAEHRIPFDLRFDG